MKHFIDLPGGAHAVIQYNQLPLVSADLSKQLADLTQQRDNRIIDDHVWREKLASIPVHFTLQVHQISVFDPSKSLVQDWGFSLSPHTNRMINEALATLGDDTGNMKTDLHWCHYNYDDCIWR